MLRIDHTGNLVPPGRVRRDMVWDFSAMSALPTGRTGLVLDTTAKASYANAAIAFNDPASSVGSVSISNAAANSAIAWLRTAQAFDLSKLRAISGTLEGVTFGAGTPAANFGFWTADANTGAYIRSQVNTNSAAEIRVLNASAGTSYATPNVRWASNLYGRNSRNLTFTLDLRDKTAYISADGQFSAFAIPVPAFPDGQAVHLGFQVGTSSTDPIARTGIVQQMRLTRWSN